MIPEFAEAGYLRVTRGGAFVSQHRQEREAIASILRHAATAGPGDYEMSPPVIHVKIKGSSMTNFLIDGAGRLP